MLNDTFSLLQFIYFNSSRDTYLLFIQKLIVFYSIFVGFDLYNTYIGQNYTKSPTFIDYFYLTLKSDAN